MNSFGELAEAERGFRIKFVEKSCRINPINLSTKELSLLFEKSRSFLLSYTKGYKTAIMECSTIQLCLAAYTSHLVSIPKLPTLTAVKKTGNQLGTRQRDNIAGEIVGLVTTTSLIADGSTPEDVATSF